VFCDDLTFHGAEEGYIALKVALDGSISTTLGEHADLRHLQPSST
jgi:predicted AAA+ superfamily ATPase